MSFPSPSVNREMGADHSDLTWPAPTQNSVASAGVHDAEITEGCGPRSLLRTATGKHNAVPDNGQPAAAAALCLRYPELGVSCFQSIGAIPGDLPDHKYQRMPRPDYGPFRKPSLGRPQGSFIGRLWRRGVDKEKRLVRSARPQSCPFKFRDMHALI